MKMLTKEVIQSYNNIEDKLKRKELTTLYLKVLEEYVEGNHPHGAYNDSLMCSIHKAFSDGHNCVACNLQVYSSMLIEFLIGYKNFKDVNLTSTNFHLLLYLLVERYNEYFKLFDLQQTYKAKYFQVFQKIVRWANFLKHPKAFLLAHHPIFWIKGMNYYDSQYFYDTIEEAKKNNKIIDDDFVKRYYSNGDNNSKLTAILKKKEDYVVVFPNPVELIKDFVIAQQKFVSLINENEVIREILEDNATIAEHFSEED
jgi:hypothetical protein